MPSEVSPWGSSSRPIAFWRSPSWRQSALGILKLIDKARLYGDAAIGIVSSLGIAGVSSSRVWRAANIDLFSYLFGNILAISYAEVWTSVLLCLCLIIVITLSYQETPGHHLRRVGQDIGHTRSASTASWCF